MRQTERQRPRAFPESVTRPVRLYRSYPLVTLRLLRSVAGAGLLGFACLVAADEPPATHRPQLNLDEFRPRSMLRLVDHTPRAARFPVVDVHTHFRFKLPQSEVALDNFVALMDRNGIAVCVSLDGSLDDLGEDHQQFIWKKHRDRFVVFVSLDWQGNGADKDFANWACHQADFVRNVTENLRSAHQRGISGLKIFKSLGLQIRNPDGSLVRIDDPRWDPIWKVCGELKLPILIHTGDPAAFFLPIDETNERWEELQRNPAWSYYDSDIPQREELLAARNRVIQRHPQTTFIGAHVANNAEDLKQVARWLDEYPNLHVDIASRIGEMGRQPYTARDFMEKYQDRIVFGTDGPWPETRIRIYWRFLETRDEYFPYSDKPFPPQGFWNIYGLGLSETALQKIYSENAARLIPGVAERLAKRRAATASGPGPDASP